MNPYYWKQVWWLLGQSWVPFMTVPGLIVGCALLAGGFAYYARSKDRTSLKYSLSPQIALLLLIPLITLVAAAALEQSSFNSGYMYLVMILFFADLILGAALIPHAKKNWLMSLGLYVINLSFLLPFAIVGVMATADSWL